MSPTRGMRQTAIVSWLGSLRSHHPSSDAFRGTAWGQPRGTVGLERDNHATPVGQPRSTGGLAGRGNLLYDFAPASRNFASSIRTTRTETETGFPVRATSLSSLNLRYTQEPNSAIERAGYGEKEGGMMREGAGSEKEGWSEKEGGSSEKEGG